MNISEKDFRIILTRCDLDFDDPEDFILSYPEEGISRKRGPAIFVEHIWELYVLFIEAADVIGAEAARDLAQLVRTGTLDRNHLLVAYWPGLELT